MKTLKLFLKRSFLVGIFCAFLSSYSQTLYEVGNDHDVSLINEGPGGVINSLQLWLKGTDGLNYSDGESVSLWSTQGRGSNATTNKPGQEPTYRDNPFKNVNFNPVVEFDNVYESFYLDSDYSYDDISTQFLEGNSGFYTQDIFVVLIPDDTIINSSFGFMDTFCGDADISINTTDKTGIGMGDYTGRVNGESICFALENYDSNEIPSDGYAVYDQNTSYDNVGIINARNNMAGTQQELYFNANNIEYAQFDIQEFLNIENSKYWIGRSEGREATLNARVCEIITYSERKNDADLTQERNRIQSYLAIKYGITLGTNGISQDYVDSDGSIIWDVATGIPAEDAFNYDIAGIGRDDDSDLHQKQSRSVNNAIDGNGRTQGVLTMGISSIYDTNNLNTSTALADKHYLIWGNNGADLNDRNLVEVNLSADISPSLDSWVQFNGIARTWKVVENGGDIRAVEVAILSSAIRTANSPNGRYLMFISDTPDFDTTSDYRLMTEDVNELGEPIVKTNYDFNGTKYITFGWAPEYIYTRSIYFDGNDDYINMEDQLNLNLSEFTISAWINRKSGSENTSILSKRNNPFTEGYDFKINSSGKLEVTWFNSSAQSITSNTTIPEDEWHHVAVIYGAGTAALYIDGVLDKSAILSIPSDTNHFFYIGAANKTAPTAYFKGHIDEVRIWNVALTEAQLRYIMNQEIENSSGFVGGSYFIVRGVVPTKNEVGTIPWSDLAAYYPMRTFTYTYTNDESGNGNHGTLRSLRTVDRQTAPLPYISANTGNWDNKWTWRNGNLQYTPGSTSIVDTNTTVDWNIVELSHNIIMDNSELPTSNNNNRTVIGLFVDHNELTLTGDTSIGSGNGITITHYLSLGVENPNALIDLEGESQLIQTEGSDLDIASEGKVERDQQGTRDLFTYNYWCSPVSTSNTLSNNTNYTVPDILKDGTDPDSPKAINFATSGYNGAIGTPITIADYWIWKYSNPISTNFPSWQHIRSTGSLKVGEGFTMKGTTDTAGNIDEAQNYVFIGKPNNAQVNTITLSPGNDYLVGNPYPSALDANQFIKDNISTSNGGYNSTNIINGALYFWDHFANSTHIIEQYQGGFATYTLMGGVSSIYTDVRINTTGLSCTQTPGRFIPVGQGFFVSTSLDPALTDIASISGGHVVIDNHQRTFKKETVSNSNAVSTVIRTSNVSNPSENNAYVDQREKIRLKFNSAGGYHRQLLVGKEVNSTNGFDLGYDAPLNENNIEDMWWIVNEIEFVIQAVNNFNADQILPLGIKINTDGISSIEIDNLENIPKELEIYLYDSVLNIYYNLKSSPYEVYLTTGSYWERFSLMFAQPDTLSNDQNNPIHTIEAFFNIDSNCIIIQNPHKSTIQNLELLNILGQSIFLIENAQEEPFIEIEVPHLKPGTYILKLQTELAKVSKKVLVK